MRSFNKATATCIFVFLIAIDTAFSQSANTNQSVNFMVDEWKRAKEYTKDYLDAMPEDGYGFKPFPEGRTFAQQFLHLTEANLRYASLTVGKPDPYPYLKTLEDDPKMRSKSAVTKITLDGYDFVIEALKSLSPTQLQEKVVLYRWTLTKEQVYFKAAPGFYTVAYLVVSFAWVSRF